jgi:DNA mismatch endonuclease (patch repair protein)
MSRQRTTDTAAEMALRRLLHAHGLRYRVHVRPVPHIRRTADIVFRPSRVAVMVDGCFWHGCPDHGTWPKANAAWWRDKIERNRHRDAETGELLAQVGWLVIRVWEHEDAQSAALRVAAAVTDRYPGKRRSAARKMSFASPRIAP